MATTVGHLIIMFIFPKLIRYLPRERRTATRLRISYEGGRGLLQSVLVTCTQLRFVIDHVEIERDAHWAADREEPRDLADFEGTEPEHPARNIVVLSMQVKGKRPVSQLIARLTEINGIIQVGGVDEEGSID
jgi:putative Mg2+ transporter-C (MgtC) family protein